MKLIVKKSRSGKWYIGPFKKTDCRFKWAGPYPTQADANEDRLGMGRFMRGSGLFESKKN